MRPIFYSPMACFFLWLFGVSGEYEVFLFLPNNLYSPEMAPPRERKNGE
jgi:hypothetical protein